MKTALLLIVMGLLLSAAFAGSLYAFDPRDLEMSVHGWAAMTLGIFLTLALGGGLMALVFYSARKGYDDAAGADPMAPNIDGDTDEDTPR